MTVLHAKTALLPQGWARDVTLSLGPDGCIATVDVAAPPPSTVDEHVEILLPAPANLHSHAFQRAMAGLCERRSTAGQDSFWTWRQLMYRFLDQLTPDDVQAIAAQVQMEMLESGYASVGEFHYLHHQPDGTPYADLAEMSTRICAAASQTGIGLTLLPVLYQQGGADGRALRLGQARFANDPDRFMDLLAAAGRDLPADAKLGVAPHSLRAVTPDALRLIEQSTSGPLHMHLAEQDAEVTEIEAIHGARPVQYLLNTQPVDQRWCLIHCTQMTPDETRGLAGTGAVAGLCPITEASLGDGIFDGVRWLASGGAIGIGSDSNIRIGLTEELRLLEYSQRLRDHSRAALAHPGGSTARRLFTAILAGGAQALGRPTGALAPGYLADLVALDATAPDLAGRTEGTNLDAILDIWVFAAGDALVCDVWAAGRHMVHNGRHIQHDTITTSYRACLNRLAQAM